MSTSEGIENIAMLQVWLSSVIMLTPTMVKGSPCSLIFYYGSCEGQKLWKITQDLASNITTLDLNENLLESLSAGDLHRYAALDTLLINHNQLKEVDVKAFLHLTELSYLDLSCNNLRHISNSIFKNNRKLTHVFLSGNKLVFSPPSPFLISSTISNLELEDCGIQKIPRLSFAKMEELHYLDLRKNKVIHLDSSSFENTKLRDLYIDSTSGIESSLTKLCENGTFVHFIMGKRLVDFCETNQPGLPVYKEETASSETSNLSSSFVILRSTVFTLSPMETKASVQETESHLNEDLTNYSSNVSVFFSSALVVPEETNNSYLEIMPNEETLEFLGLARKLNLNANKTLTVSIDSNFFVLIGFLLLLLCSSLTLMQWLYYNRKLQNNVSQCGVKKNTTSEAPTNSGSESLLLLDSQVSVNDGVLPIPQLVLHGFTPDRPLPSPPSSSRWSLVSNHKYDKLQFL